MIKHLDRTAMIKACMDSQSLCGAAIDLMRYSALVAGYADAPPRTVTSAARVMQSVARKIWKDAEEIAAGGGVDIPPNVVKSWTDAQKRAKEEA